MQPRKEKTNTKTAWYSDLFHQILVANAHDHFNCAIRVGHSRMHKIHALYNYVIFWKTKLDCM